MIVLQHVSKVFAGSDKTKQVHAVDNVNLTIQDGDIFGIIGFSGAGKSTLVRCINLLERPTSGSVEVDGQELTRMSAKELRQARKKIGMIFQHFNLMPSRTIFGNVAYPLRGIGKKSTACWSWWASLTRRTPTPASSPAVKNSGWPSHEPWPTTPRFCSVMKPPRP